MSPPAVPPRQQSSEFPQFRRSHTPDRNVFSKPPAPRPYRSGSGGTASLHGRSPSEDKPFAGFPRPQSVSHFGDNRQSTQPSPSASFLEPSYNQDRRMSLGGPIPRPSSQPHFDGRSRRTQVFSPVTQPAAAFDDGQHKVSSSQRTRQHVYPGLEAQPSPRFGPPPGERERYLHEQASREQENATPVQQELRRQQPSQPRFGSELPQHEGERQRRHPWEPDFQRVSPEATRASEGANFGFGAIQNYTKSLGSQISAPRSIPGGPPQHTRQEPTPPNDMSSVISGRNPAPSRTYSPIPGSQNATAEEQQRAPADEVLQHRSLLHINAENKRTGRASPLPQAVQGAQAQLLGPAAEAVIGSELGRVFSGIGSGVGASAPIGSGPPTPLNSSPFKREALAPQDGDPSKSGRASSSRRRRARADEGKVDGELGAAQRDGTWVHGMPRKGRHIHHHHRHGHQ